MLDLFGSLKAAIKRREITTDNAIFKLHYLFTSILLIAFSLMVTARQYFGNPIDCIQPDNIPFINVYCWIHSTYTMPGAFHNKVLGSEIAHPGVENSKGQLDDRKFYAYYQWVCFVLFFQALLFYLPRYLWRMWEGGLLANIISGLNVCVLSEDDKNNKKKILLEYLTRTFRRHTMYAVKYYLCEVLCLVNVIGQMYLMNRFLGGEFLDYGSRVLEFSETNQDNRTDPMVYVFPRMTKCVFHKYGTSGDIQKHDALCVLPLNIVNEKIYIFLWFWFIILAVLTSILLCYRVVIIAFPRLRPQILHAIARLTPNKTISSLLRNANLGDWFLFYLLGKNIDPVTFREICSDLTKKLETAESNNP